MVEGLEVPSRRLKIGRMGGIVRTIVNIMPSCSLVRVTTTSCCSWGGLAHPGRQGVVRVGRLGAWQQFHYSQSFSLKEVETTLVRVRAGQALCWQCVAVGGLPHRGHRVAASVAGWKIVTSSTTLVTSPTTLTTIAVPVAQRR